MLFWLFKSIFSLSKFGFVFITLTLAFELSGKEYGLFLSALQFLLFLTFSIARVLTSSLGIGGILSTLEAFLTVSLVTTGPRLFEATEALQYLIISPWQLFLQLALPISILLEGLASVVVFSEIGKVVNRIVQIKEGTQSLFLGSAVGILIFSGFGIKGILSATLSSTYGFFMGSLITCAVALSALAMHLEKNSIIDSALLIAYITFNFWMISNPLNETPIHIEQPGLDWDYLQVLSLDWRAVVLHISKLFSNMFSFFWSVSDQFIISLFYRFGIIYAGIRIISVLRNGDEEDPFETSISFTSILGLLIKPLFVAMYTYSLMSHYGYFTAYSQFWQWLNIIWSLAVYVDAVFFAHEDNPSIVDHWKMD
ncbi:hypothetical protein K7432_015171 [Basidiobolus ranarum]|uniref:Uncharacterized protein n=1 Tax=Basidiobolus ranarum TaxID=34480 RepID=A0ABR2VNG0_9FUNG